MTIRSALGGGRIDEALASMRADHIASTSIRESEANTSLCEHFEPRARGKLIILQALRAAEALKGHAHGLLREILSDEPSRGDSASQ